jgi:Trypsin
VRLGEWDSATATEPIPAQEFFVSRIFVHPQFNSANLKNNIALLRLSSFVPLGAVPTISTVCLPSNQLFGMRCWIAGRQKLAKLFD